MNISDTTDNKKPDNKKPSFLTYTLAIITILTAFINFLTEYTNFKVTIYDHAQIANNNTLPENDSSQVVSSLDNTYSLKYVTEELTVEECINRDKFSIVYSPDDITEFSYYEDINSKRDSLQRQINQSESFFDKYISKYVTDSYRVTIQETIDGVKRICLLKDINSTYQEMESLVAEIKENEGIENLNVLVSYNEYFDLELQDLEELVHNSKYTLALNGLLQLRYEGERFINNRYRVYSKKIENIILSNTELLKLYRSGYSTRSPRLNFD